MSDPSDLVTITVSKAALRNLMAAANGEIVAVTWLHPDGSFNVFTTDRSVSASAAAAALGRLGASKGGRARAERLTPTQRSAIARKAAMARWAQP